jgi:homoserine kinase
VAAALLGGFTVAWNDAEGVHAVSLPVDESITPVAFVPGAVRVSTSKSRGLLPEHVPHADAARTAGRAALLAPALGGRLDLLMAATDDFLHQPYRLPVQPRGAQLVERLRAAGHAATLSGSGPTVLALCTSPARAADAVGIAGRGWDPQVLPVDRAGVRAVPLD